jgi:hypothetical protein
VCHPVNSDDSEAPYGANYDSQVGMSRGAGGHTAASTALSPPTGNGRRRWRHSVRFCSMKGSRYVPTPIYSFHALFPLFLCSW